MRHTFILHLFFLLPLLSSFQLQAQQTFSASLMTESIAFPLTRIAPVHPGVELGYTLTEKQNPSVVRSFNLYLGWYYHEKLENSVYLRGEIGWGMHAKDIGTLDLYTGAGYMHVFYPGDIYELNKKSGDFEAIRQTGRAHALINAGIGFTYRKLDRISPFIRQDLAIETPFANGIPVIIHSFFKIGTSIRIGS